MDAQLAHRREGDHDAPVLVWRLSPPRLAISSGPYGGGLGIRHWVVNATVPMSYDRDDPDVHLAELADQLGLDGPGVGLLTGVDVAEVVTATDAGVTVWATVGLSPPAWAAAPGTINVVVDVPVRLCDAAMVNAVATVAEAKAQALWDIGFPGTGTPTDATCVLCSTEGPAEPYGGPRSTWGARIARAVHQSVMDARAARR